MSVYLISVFVRTRADADCDRIAELVVGKCGSIQRAAQRTRFWARTPLTIKQVQAIEGVEECYLAPAALRMG